MGGCASLEQVTKKIGEAANDVKNGVGNAVGKVADLSPVSIPLLSTALKTYKLNETRIDILEKNVYDAKVQNIFVPVSENLKFDITQFDVPQDQKANFEKEIEKLINENQVELNKQNIVNVVLDGIKNDHPLHHFKNIMLFRVPAASNDVIANVILNITKRAEELKLDHLALPKIQRSNQIGANDADIAKVVAKTVYTKYSKLPVQGEVHIPRLAFFCNDTKWNQDLVKACDDAPKEATTNEPGKKPESGGMFGFLN
jgi:hypothetical protein